MGTKRRITKNEPKPLAPTLEHWEQAEIAGASVWKRWRPSHSWMSSDDVVPELQLACIEQYGRWDPSITDWFPWCCYVASRRVITLVNSTRSRYEISVGEFMSHEPRTTEDSKIFHATEEVYNRLHPLDKWIIDLRTKFCTNWEAAAYLRLCGMTDLELDRSAHRIYNEASKPDTYFPVVRKRWAKDRLDKLFVKLKAGEAKLTKEKIATILDGKFEYRQTRNTSGKHRKIPICNRNKGWRHKMDPNAPACKVE